jgi:DNA repair protein RadA/Sms
MRKKKSKEYVCTGCGYRSPIRLGKCPECGTWNSFIEISESNKETVTPISITSETIKLSEERIKTGNGEFDRVLGGGIVRGSIILVGGEPGIGKSTLLLQIASIFAKKGKVLYVSGEESYLQIRMRAKRLGTELDNLYLLIEQNIELIENTILQENPVLVVIDSVQTMFSPHLEGSAGSVAQVKECTRIVTDLAKKNGIPIMLVGHVTKGGIIAGPKTIEHLVDGVFYLEGERTDMKRILRGVKNRFGTTNEVGIFEMREKGLIEAENPMLTFISMENEFPVGSVITATLEGSLPIFIEVQALATPTYFPIPRRVVSGVDYNRLLLIIAILEKRLHLKLGSFDIYANTVGGFKTLDRAIDLSIAVAIMSNIFEKSVSEKTVVFGELGLGGEIRPTIGAERKAMFGKRLGFKNFILPAFFKDKIEIAGVDFNFVDNIKDVKEILF